MTTVSLKKVTFYYNRDRYEAFSKIVRVDSKMSNKDIVKNILVDIFPWEEERENIDISDNFFYNAFDGITTDYKVEKLKIIDLT